MSETPETPTSGGRSLRARTSRPSYAALFPTLDGDSSDDSNGSSSGDNRLAQRRGSGAGRVSIDGTAVVKSEGTIKEMIKKPRRRVKDSEDESDVSDFNPTDDSQEEKDDEEDDVSIAHTEEDDKSGSEPSDVEPEPLGSDPGSPKRGRKSRGRGGASGGRGGRGRRGGGAGGRRFSSGEPDDHRKPPTFVPTATSLLPLPDSALNPARGGPSGVASARPDRDPRRQFTENQWPVYPDAFQTCLVERPTLRRKSIVAKGKGAEREAYFERVRIHTEKAPGMVPWEGWLGEGWWPHKEDGDEGWNAVHSEWHGLDMLGASEGAAYLPKPTISAPTEVLTGLVSHENQDQQLSSLPIYSSTSLRSLRIPKSGSIIAAGGPVWSLSWAPSAASEPDVMYLALAVHTSLDSTLPIGHPKPRKTKGSLQIWSVRASGEGDWEMESKLEMLLCSDEGGSAWQLEWCPVGGPDELDGKLPRIGVLAATYEDGRIRVFAVPDPAALRREKGLQGSEGPLYLRPEPLTTLEVDDGLCWCLNWGSARSLAVGTTAGFVVVWDVQAAILSKDESPLPTHYIRAHTGPIRRIAYLRHPQPDGDGKLHSEWEQSLIASSALNGRICLTDLRDASGSAGGGGGSAEIHMARSSALTGLAAQIQTGSLIQADADYAVYIARIRPDGFLMTSKASQLSGQVWDVSSSDYHMAVASASADGSLQITNTMRGTTKNKRDWVSLLEPVYRIDRSSTTSQIRLLDNILPQNLSLNRSLPSVLSKHKDATARTNAIRGQVVAWEPEIGVLCARWNSANGIGRAGLLASGMACGLVRIDFVEGHWKGSGLTEREARIMRKGLVT